MDFATLVLAADSRGLVAGEQALNSLATAAERTESRTGKALSDVGKAAEQVGKQSSFAAQNSRMMAMQLSQVAQQASATGNYLQAIAIQLPDLALGFGPIGIAAGAAAGAVLSYFATYDGGEDANDVLKEQEELIRRVVDVWGEAVPALQAYIDQLDKAREVTDLLQAADVAANDKWKVARSDISGLGEELATLVVDLQQAGAEDETILQLQDAFAKVQEAVASGHGDVEAMKDVQDALADAIDQTGIPALSNFATAFASLAQSISGAIRGAQVFKAEAIQALTLVGNELKPLAPLFSEGGKIYSGDDFTPRNPATPDTRPLIELDGLPGEFGRGRGGGRGRGRRGGGGGKSQAELYDDLIKDAERRIASLTAEREAVGLSEQAAEKLRSETEMLNDAQQRGIKLTDEQKTNISGLAEQMASLDAETKAAQEQMDFFNDISDDLKDGILDAIVEGKNLDDVFQDLAKTIAKAALEAALFGSGPLSGGGTGEGGFGGILGGLLGKLFSFEGGGYTGSGSRSGGLDGKGGYMALVHPDETVIDHTKGGAGGSQGLHVTFGVAADNNGNFLPFVDKVTDNKIGRAAPGIVNEANKRVVPTMSMHQMQKAGGDYRLA